MHHDELQDDKQLLKDLFDQLKNTSTTPERRKDLTTFLKEFCAFSTSLQPNGPQGREAFYKVMTLYELLYRVLYDGYNWILVFSLSILSTQMSKAKVE